jgi:hypothetical protein
MSNSKTKTDNVDILYTKNWNLLFNQWQYVMPTVKAPLQSSGQTSVTDFANQKGETKFL